MKGKGNESGFEITRWHAQVGHHAPNANKAFQNQWADFNGT